MEQSRRLYVTPDEVFGKAKNNRVHPHGGEGNCGGREGHGTPELARSQGAGGGNSGRRGPTDGGARRTSDLPSREQPKKSASAPVKNNTVITDTEKPKETSPSGFTREGLAWGIKASVILSEPACRRYGMPAYVRNKRS